MRRSVCRLGHDVSRAAATTSASISVQGAWQIAATGLPDSTNWRTNATASSSVRSASGLATPPGSTSAVVVGDVGARHGQVDVEGVALVEVVERLHRAVLRRRARGVAAGLLDGLPGPVSSTCSMPSGATRKATLRCSLVFVVVLVSVVLVMVVSSRSDGMATAPWCGAGSRQVGPYPRVAR